MGCEEEGKKPSQPARERANPAFSYRGSRQSPPAALGGSGEALLVEDLIKTEPQKGPFNPRADPAALPLTEMEWDTVMLGKVSSGSFSSWWDHPLPQNKLIHGK